MPRKSCAALAPRGFGVKRQGRRPRRRREWDLGRATRDFFRIKPVATGPKSRSESNWTACSDKPNKPKGKRGAIEKGQDVRIYQSVDHVIKKFGWFPGVDACCAIVQIHVGHASNNQTAIYYEDASRDWTPHFLSGLAETNTHTFCLPPK